MQVIREQAANFEFNCKKHQGEIESQTVVCICHKDSLARDAFSPAMEQPGKGAEPPPMTPVFMLASVQ